MNKSPKYNQQQAEPKDCKFEVEKLPGNWPLRHLYLKININSGLHAREDVSDETIYI